VLGVGQLDIARALGAGVAHVVQPAVVALVPVATALASGTRAATIVSRATFNRRLGQILC
jgi:hypothetical protein